MENTLKLTPAVFALDVPATLDKISRFIAGTLADSPREGIVVPISGGLDSSVVAALCVRAVGPAQVLGLMLPERFGNPEAVRFGRMVADHLGLTTRRLNITPILRGVGSFFPFISALAGRERTKPAVHGWMEHRGMTTRSYFLADLRGTLDPTSRRLIANIAVKQRARMLATYRVADEANFLVAGAAHKTEDAVGLFIKYGVDDAADLMPLLHLQRSHILQLADGLELPAEIIGRPPNPDILPGVTDKYVGELGMGYETVDLIIYGSEHGLSAQEIGAQLGIATAAVAELQEIIRLAEWTRSHALAPQF